MKKPARKKAVKVYLHPRSTASFIYKGSTFLPPETELDPRKLLMAFWLEESLYLNAVKKHEARLAAGETESFPQFVLLDAEVSEKKPRDLEDQAADRVGGLGGKGRPDVIIKAFEALDHDDDKVWNKDGTPSIRYLEKQIGFDITRVELEGLVPDIMRDTEEDRDEDDED